MDILLCEASREPTLPHVRLVDYRLHLFAESGLCQRNVRLLVSEVLREVSHGRDLSVVVLKLLNQLLCVGVWDKLGQQLLRLRVAEVILEVARA